ncbi:MAG: homoserine O-acetyltransferase [Phycisphaerales bacterium JB065]
MTTFTNNWANRSTSNAESWSRGIRPLRYGADPREVVSRDRSAPIAPQTVRVASEEQPLLLESGVVLDEVDVAFETIGRLNAAGDNAVLVCHPLSADTHAARRDSGDRPGWWETMIGPGLPIDPARDFVITANVLGGSFGTTGPTSVDPNTGEPWGPRFPVVTVGDMVRVQRRLLDALGITKPVTVIGGGLGALVALESSIREPERVGRAVVLGAAARRQAQALAIGSLARRAVQSDPNFRDGWYAPDRRPTEGLSIARGLLHSSERSAALLERRFGRSRRDEARSRFTLENDHSVEWYLDATGGRFADRFDANAFLRLSKAADLYDAAAGRGGLVRAMQRVQARTLFVGLSSDGVHLPGQTLELHTAALEAGVDSQATLIETSEGHEAYLTPDAELRRVVREFLDLTSNEERREGR